MKIRQGIRDSEKMPQNVKKSDVKILTRAFAAVPVSSSDLGLFEF